MQTIGRVFLLLVAGVLFANIVRSAAVATARVTRLPIVAAIVLTVLVMVTCGAGCFYLLGATLLEQSRLLAEQLPGFVRGVVHWVEHDPLLRDLFGSALVQGVVGDAHEVAASARNALASSVLFVGAVVIVFFMGVYGAAQPDAYIGPLLRLVPRTRRARAADALREMNHDVTRWLFGRLIAMVIVGVLVTGGLALLRIPFAFVLGVSAGLLTFVEYVGPIASAIAPTLVALTRGPLSALWVLLLFLGVHVIDGYIVSPLIAKQMTRLPPAFTLSMQVLFGAIFGAAGVALAVPICIVIVILVQTIYVEGVLGER